NNKRLGQNKNLMPNSEYQEYNSDDQTNSSVTEPEAISNINITKKSLFTFFEILIIDFSDTLSFANVKYFITKINKTKDTKSQVEPVSIKKIEYTSLDEVDSITEINKTKNIKLMSVFDDHNEVEKDTKSQVKPVSAKRVKRISVSDDHTELVAHNEVEKHILSRRLTCKKRT
ncbi:5873_t:CDS:2, partial [Funneliformis caledonium]